MEGINKMPRYMKEYANSKITYLCRNYAENAEFPITEKIAEVVRAQEVYRRGLITIDEAMKLIAEA